MPEITADLLDRFSLKNYADPESISRGELYYKEGRVISTTYDNEVYSFKVIGSGQSYQVRIKRPTEDQLSFTCSCPHARRVAICKHIVAAVMSLKDQLKKNMSACGKTRSTPRWTIPLGKFLRPAAEQKTLLLFLFWIN